MIHLLDNKYSASTNRNYGTNLIWSASEGCDVSEQTQFDLRVNDAMFLKVTSPNDFSTNKELALTWTDAKHNLNRRWLLKGNMYSKIEPLCSQNVSSLILRVLMCK